MRLQGKVVLVTGAAKRVGRAIAMRFAQRGAKLAIHYNRSREEAQRFAEEARSISGQSAKIFKADLSDVRQVERLASAVLKEFGAIHVLVNSASLYERNVFGKTKLSDWDRHLNANLRGPFFLSQA